MNFTLNQLRIFLNIVEQKSITKAAEKLFLTQPAVSIQLKNFQGQFDIPLIEVINKRLFVTDFGYEIAEAAKSILNEVNAINYKKAIFEGKLTGKLKIAVVSTGKYVIPYLLTDFLKVNPEVELELDVSNRGNVINNLEKNNVDFVLMTRLPENLSVESTKLFQNKLVLVGGKDSKIQFQKMKGEFFNQHRFIFRESGSATRQAMENYLLEQKISTENILTLTSNEAVKQAVISGMGCSIVPIIGIRNELELVQLEMLNAPGLPIENAWYLVHLKEKKLLPAARAFKLYIKENLSSIILNYFNSKFE
jgi:DNA-binding transcriptional LysR family regulator